MNTFTTIEAARQYAASKSIVQGRVCLVTLASGEQAYIVIRGGIAELRVQIKARKIPAIKSADAEFDLRDDATAAAERAAFAAKMAPAYADQAAHDRIVKAMHTGRG